MSCLFKSLAHFIHNIDEHTLRTYICDYLNTNPCLIDDIQLDIITRLDSNMSLPQYINNMSNQNTWGGGIEIKCFCNLFNIKVNVHISNNIIEFLPSNNTPIGQINILYTGNHYEPIG
jgi:hypothetical protein